MNHYFFDYMQKQLIGQKITGSWDTIIKAVITAEAIIYLADKIFSGLSAIAGELRRIAQEINLSK